MYLTKNGYGTMEYLSHEEVFANTRRTIECINSPNAASKLIKKLEEKVKILTVFPKIFSQKIHNDNLVYKFKIQNYSVYYYIQEDTVTICNIFYSKKSFRFIKQYKINSLDQNIFGESNENIS